MLDRILKIYRSDNSQVLLGNLSASAFGLVTFMLPARGLSVADFGAWTLFVSTSGLLDLLRTGLVRQAMVRAISIGNDKKTEEILASAGTITVIVSALSSLVVLSIFILSDTSSWSLDLFFRYYPIFTILTIVSNLDTWKSHALGKFRRMNRIRLYINILFVAGVTVGLVFEFTIHQVMWCYLGANGLVSLYSYLSTVRFTKWRLATKERMRSLFDFGRHSLATLTGANLLKSADSLIIGALLGTEAVAIYAIPLKALDLVEIPLRGFAMTGFRKLSQLASQNLWQQFNEFLLRNVLLLTLALMPLAGLFIIAPALVIRVLGGEGFGESTILLMIFVIPMILLPLDKFLGISYDSIGKPKMNAQKVWIMVTVNIIGDFLAIHFVGTLWSVAAVTVLNIVMGIVFGLLMHPQLSFRMPSQKSTELPYQVNRPTRP